MVCQGCKSSSVEKETADREVPERMRHLLLHEAGRRWFDSVPTIISELAAKWALDLGQPFQRSSVSYTLPALRAGQPMVLKIQWPHDECQFEADALQYLSLIHI